MYKHLDDAYRVDSKHQTMENVRGPYEPSRWGNALREDHYDTVITTNWITTKL